MANLYTPDENIVDGPDEYPPSNKIFEDRDNVEVSTINLPDQISQTLSVDDRTYLYLDQIGAAVEVEPPPDPDYGPPQVFSFVSELKGFILRFRSSIGGRLNTVIRNGSGVIIVNNFRNGSSSEVNVFSSNPIPLGQIGPFTFTIQAIEGLEIYNLVVKTQGTTINPLPTFSNCTTLSYFNMQQSGIVDINISGLPLGNLQLTSNKLDYDKCQLIINNLITTNIFGGTLLINPQAGPVTINLYPAIQTLIDRGWFIS